MLVSLNGRQFDVRFERVVSGEKYGFYRNGQPRIRQMCSISLVNPEKTGRERYTFEAGGGVFDTMRADKPMARKRSFAQALAHFRLKYNLPKSVRQVWWEQYFAQVENHFVAT